MPDADYQNKQIAYNNNMKLFLTSAGLANKQISDAFLGLLDKPVGEIKVIFIPTASRYDDELFFVEKSKQQLIDVGIKNIIKLDLDHLVTDDELKGDIVYVCGGNTFYLMQQIRSSGFDQKLRNFNGIYFGTSAGSVAAGPNIEVAGPWDDNDVNLGDTTGIGLVDFAVIPHYQRKEKQIVDSLRHRAEYKIIELTDDQAILSDGVTVKIID